jgi:hypothetical protein
MLAARFVVVVVGPKGAGKSKVASHLAGPHALILDRRLMDEALVQQLRTRKWHPELLSLPTLVIDGPSWLETRVALRNAIRDLIRLRTEAQRRTFLCQRDEDGSVSLLMDELEPGSTVLLGLRFPKGRRGRLRFATRVCDQEGWNKKNAQRTVDLEPWGYDVVIDTLRRLENGEDLPRLAASHSLAVPPPT